MYEVSEDSREQAIKVSPNDCVVSVALVKSGTSRIIVVDGRTAPSGMQLSELAGKLLGHDDLLGSLGGQNYQLNKVAIWKPSEGIAQFHFFNLDTNLTKIISGAECGHAAAAVGLMAILEQSTDSSERNARVINLDTHQVIVCSPISSERFWNTLCKITVFEHEQATAPLIQTVHVDELNIETKCCVFHHGNSFALVEGLYSCENLFVRRSITSKVVESARESKRSNLGVEYVRCIPYAVEWLSSRQAVVRCRCYNSDKMHQSMPVSGAIVLCEYLSMLRLAEIGESEFSDVEESKFLFAMESPSGREPAEVSMKKTDGEWFVESTCINSEIQLLFLCKAILSL